MPQVHPPSPGSYQDSPTEQLAQILDATQDAIMAITLADRRLIYKSASFEQVFGYDVQAFLDDPHFANHFVHPDDLALTLLAQADALRDGFAELDHRVVFPSGEVRWLHRRARVFFDAEKRPIQVIDSARDITAHKAAEEALAASENRYRQIVETAQEGIWLVDLEGRTIYANQRMADMLGYSVAEIMREDVLFFMDDAARRQAEYYRARRRQGIQEQHDFRLRRKDGSDLWVIVNTNLIFDGAGCPVSELVMLTDITARKQAEDALQEANRLLEERIAERTAELQEERSLLRTVIDSVPDFIYVKDRRHRMLLNNQAHSHWLGVTSAADLLGKTDLELSPSALALQYQADDDQVFASGQPLVDREEQGIHPDGSAAWILTTKVPLRNTQGEIAALVGITRDITARKAAEAAIEAALVSERELGELKSRFVSMASHEFRNPLAGILTTVETLSLLWERMDKTKIEDRLNRIRSQVLRMTEITEDVLRFTRLQTGRSKLDPAPGDLAELCDRVVADLTELPGNHGRICYECAERPLPAVFDARILQQVIGNLLHNALKYSPSATTVHLAVAQTRGQITLCIADAGIGIPPEDLPHLFEPFHRAGNVGAIQGTGLGLAIAKEAVELHGGTIAVTSRVGEGTTFTVTVPGH